MKVDFDSIIKGMSRLRQAKGLTLRELAHQTGVSFSTLGRLERGESAPDNNTYARIYDWLSKEDEDLVGQFKAIGEVHFRASKNLDSKTVESLLSVALTIKEKFAEK